MLVDFTDCFVFCLLTPWGSRFHVQDIHLGLSKVKGWKADWKSWGMNAVFVHVVPLLWLCVEIQPAGCDVMLIN